jgi:hypothetical protein
MLAGTATAPRWIAQLDYAAVCGKEPHEVFGGSRALWWYRWKARRDIGIEVQKHFDRKNAQRTKR